MDYKEKLVELMTKCLNDEKLYDEVIDQVDAYKSNSQQLYYNKVSSIHCGHFDAPTTTYTSYYFNNVRYHKSVSEMKEKYKLVDLNEYSKEKFLSELQINFTEYPPLRLFRHSTEKIDRTNINIPNKRFLFFNGPEQYVVKTTHSYTTSYKIQQGSLEAELTVEEANVLIELYKTNKKVFEEKRDLEKLEGRLKQYNN